MSDTTHSETSDRSGDLFVDRLAPVPGILVAYAPAGSVTVDRCALKSPFVIGRSSKSSFSIHDDKVSKSHVRINQHKDGFRIEDLGSTNGTFIDGYAIHGNQLLPSPCVIRVGRAVLVFHDNARALIDPPPAERFAMAGRFHAGPLIVELREAAISKRHILLAGPSGSGKDLAARAIVAMVGRGGKAVPFVDYNAARFASEDEAMTSLFGAGDQVFTGVKARMGLIEQAHQGVLFIDEVHNLPIRVQRGLLKVIEGGTLQRIGETKDRPAEVRFVFASNEPQPLPSLAPDLLNRLRVVSIPSLGERTADIPTIFDRVLKKALAEHGVNTEAVLPLLGGDHYEILCLDGFENDNVRGLVDLADRLVTRIGVGVEPAEAISAVFSERFDNSLVARRKKGEDLRLGKDSHYEKNKDQIIAAFNECNRVVVATEHLLDERGIKCSRRWLAVYLKEWGLR